MNLLDHIAVVLMVFALIAVVAERFFRAWRKPTLEDSSLILAYYTQDADLMHAAEREVGGLSYNVLAASDRSSMREPVTICMVNLPFTSKVHLLAVPTGRMPQLNPAGWGSPMERVNLEGDFPNNFSLYALKGQGMEARYVLDPGAMSHVVDVCGSVSWELIDDELFFVTSDAQIDDNFIADFVREIRPAVELPADTEQQMLPQYRKLRPKELQCPLCREVMQRKPHWYECDHGHGRLISGRYLIAVSRGEMSLPAPTYPAERTHGVLKCPFCQHEMQQVEYLRRVPIDSCTNCPYRWLDGSELSKVIM